MRYRTPHLPGASRTPPPLRNGLLPAAAVLLVILVLVGLATAYDRRIDSPARLFDGAGLTAAFSAFELIFLYAVLRPWSYDGDWGRAASAALLLLPDALVSLARGMTGPVPAFHAMWVLGIEVALVVTAGVSGASRALEHAPARRVASAPVEVL
jgi:hypothetical protein